MTFLGVCAFALVVPQQAVAAPGVVIASPDDGSVSYESLLQVTGTVKGITSLKDISCITDEGHVGIVTPTSYTYSSTTGGVYTWVAKVELEPYFNTITITATDSSNNQYSASLDVIYIPSSTSGIDQELILDYRGKAKFTFYFGGTSYKNLDRFSIVGYLAKAVTDPWALPFTKAATVSVSVHIGQTDQNVLVFTQTIPANKVVGVHTYRYTSRSAGIQDLLLQEWKPTETSFYVFVDKINMLPSQRAAMTSADYTKLVQSMDSFTVTFTAGTSSWVGTAPLRPGNRETHKQEMTYNR